MDNIKDIVSRLEKDVFSNKNITRSILINHYTFETNALNEEVLSFDNQETVNAVVLNYEQVSKKYDKLGYYNDSSCVILLPHTINVCKYDEIEFGGQSYEILTVNTPLLGEDKVVNRVFVRLK